MLAASWRRRPRTRDVAIDFLEGIGIRLANAARGRLHRAAERAKFGAAPARGFFDDYPRFFESSVTAASPNRLNLRHRACIAGNGAALRDRRVLDIASHDGRWSFAALMAGARHVTGIEARAHLVRHAVANLHAYGVPDDRFRFIEGDVFREIDALASGSIDTVLCFGFFYHTPHHMGLLAKIERLGPRFLLLDTVVELDPRSAVVLRSEPTDVESKAAPEAGSGGRAVVGVPSRAALELMLAHFGWRITYYDWHRAGIRSWANVADYRDGHRLSLLAARD
jgi:SAM-dependent methyltransferase